MSDETEDLLRRLGALEREYDDDFPHEWEQVVRGEASAEQVAARRREAGDDPQEVEALAEQLRPLDDAAREAWVDRLADALNDSGAAQPAAEPREDAEPTEATVVSLNERRGGRAPWVAAVVGMLAAAGLVLWLTPRGGPGPGSDPGVSLPVFSLTVRNETVHDVRSGDDDPGAVARYLPQTRVQWLVRPERSFDERVGLRVLAQAAETDERRWIDPEASVNDRGVIEVRGRFDRVIGLPAGRWSLRLVVGSPPPDDLAAFDAGGSWTVVEPAYEIEVLPPQ